LRLSKFHFGRAWAKNSALTLLSQTAVKLKSTLMASSLCLMSHRNAHFTQSRGLEARSNIYLHVDFGDTSAEQWYI
jgi:hypothetical protein